MCTLSQANKPKKKKTETPLGSSFSIYGVELSAAALRVHVCPRVLEVFLEQHLILFGVLG